MKFRSALTAALAVVALFPGQTAADELPSASELLERSIRYHDPHERWGREPLELTLLGTRPGGPDRTTRIEIDLAGGVFTWATTRDGHELAARVERDAVEATMNGSSDIPADASELYRLSDADVLRKRDYYTYLWGLPMKLRDPGTRIDDTVSATEFQGDPVLALRVSYDPEVGGDTWYFYFDPDSAALVGYRFFHDESQNDGEYITTEGEVKIGGLRLPDNRAWYYNRDDGYLGTDSLVVAGGN